MLGNTAVHRTMLEQQDMYLLEQLRDMFVNRKSRRFIHRTQIRWSSRHMMIISNVSKAVKVAVKLIPLDQKLRKEYLRVLSRSPKLSHLKLLKKAKSGLLQQKVTIPLNKRNARKLKSLAARKDVEVAEMADEILSSYLKRR